MPAGELFDFGQRKHACDFTLNKLIPGFSPCLGRL
jgi:hypothetical protein